MSRSTPASMDSSRNSSGENDAQPATWQASVTTVGALASITGLGLLIRQLWFGDVLVFPVVAMIVPALTILLAFSLVTVGRKFPLVEGMLGGLAVAFIIALTLDLARPLSEVLGLVGVYFLAGGVASGATRTAPFRRVLFLAWASIAVGFLLVVAVFFADERHRDDAIATTFMLMGPALIASTGYWIGSHVGRLVRPKDILCLPTRHPGVLASWLALALSLSYLAIVPAYVVDRVGFREPAFEVTLLDGGQIALSPETVRTGPFGIEYRVTNAGSEPQRLMFYEHGDQHPPDARTVPAGESFDAVISASGGPGKGDFRLCNGIDGACTKLTVK